MNNKILMYSIFMFVITIASCADDDIYENNYNEAIVFSVENSNEAFARGTPILVSDNISNICVYGYYTGDGSDSTWNDRSATATPSYFDGIKLTNNGVGTSSPFWAYEGLVFWPKSSEANVSFFAYSPVKTDLNGITVTNTIGVPTLHYSVPTNTVDQPDLMIAVPKLDQNITTGSPVTLEMKHALTCISFQGTGNNRVIESVTLSGISLEGDLSMDGTSISWSNLSTPDTTTIKAVLNNDTINSSMSTDLTASDGYLMLIPQELGSGAKITVKIQNDSAMVFDLSDYIWEAGQNITYELVVDRPEGALTISPSTLTVSPLGIDIDTLTMICTPSYATWKLTSPESWLTLSLNPDGSDASSSVSGIGNSKIYVVVDTFMINAMKDRTVALYEGDDSLNVKVNITQKCMMNIPSSTKSYAGAFWRCAQKGERLIRIPSTIGDWKAFVFWMDDQWKEGDIILNGSEFTWPVPAVEANSDTPAVSGSATSLTGDTSSGYVRFRIGLKNTYTATSDNPARYALLAITWDDGNSAQFFFIRQGEDPDYIMGPTDAYGNEQSWASSPNWRPNANKISPFNLTADTLNMKCNRARTGDNPSRFTDYPTQVGAFFQWANSVNPRYAYSPISTASIWSNTWPAGYWETLMTDNESCPKDYTLTYGTTVDFRRINNGIITGPTKTDISVSEIVQSLYYSPTSSVDNMMYAFLADGFFDRLSIDTDQYAVNTESEKVGYWGQLVYNPITKASIFIPYSGYLVGENGMITSRGQYINMWTSSADEAGTAIIWNFNDDNGGALLNNNRSAGFTIRPVID